MIIADQPPSSCRLHQWNRGSAKQRGYRAQREETQLPPCIGPSMVVCLRTHRLRGLSPKSNEDHITFLIFADLFPHIFRTSQHQNHQYQYFLAENYNFLGEKKWGTAVQHTSVILVFTLVHFQFVKVPAKVSVEAARIFTAELCPSSMSRIQLLWTHFQGGDMAFKMVML